MTELEITTGTANIPIHLSVPHGDAPWPGVVVVHDALGMTTDLRSQADWLASEGFLAAAPDLYNRDGRLRCMFQTIRAAVRREGDAFDDLDATRRWLASREDCTGRTGVIGFCMGGGYALLLAAGWGYHASSVNYGGVPKDAETYLAEACPIVASYGAKDPTLRRAPDQLEHALTTNGIDHDVTVYPHAGHAFLNDHPRRETPWWALVMGALSRSGYHHASAPHLLAKDGYVIWTRGASEPDRRPEVRSWFRAAGLAELSFDGPPETFGVGVNQLVLRALVRAVVLVVHRAGSLAVRVGRRWTIFRENPMEATKEARNRFVAHCLRLSLRLQGLRR